MGAASSSEDELSGAAALTFDAANGLETPKLTLLTQPSTAYSGPINATPALKNGFTMPPRPYTAARASSYELYTVPSPVFTNAPAVADHRMSTRGQPDCPKQYQPTTQRFSQTASSGTWQCCAMSPFNCSTYACASWTALGLFRQN
jgi:hypothetical protein